MPKNAQTTTSERQRTDALELCYWRRLLRIPWTARRSNQSILKEICPEYSLEGLMLKLKLQSLASWCKELTHWKRPWCWVRLKAGGEGDNRGWDGWMALSSRWIWVRVDSRSWWWTGRPGVLWFMGSQRVRHDWATELNWTWAFFGIAFLWDWNENWPFPVLWPLLSFPNLLAYWVQDFNSVIFQDLK